MNTPSQILYIEDEYNDEINQFFLDHQELIHGMARKKGLEFIYIPELFNETSSSDNRLEELVHYFFPFSKERVIGSPKLDYFTTPFVTHFLLPKLSYLGNKQPGLIRLTDNLFYDYKPFLLSDKQPLKEQCVAYFSQYPDAPEKAVPEPGNLLDKLKRDLEEFRGLGIYEHLLKEIGEALNNTPGKKKARPKELSRLVIDANYRIWLPDYNDLEIKMPSLSKALYLLFLLHPEGILLKSMPDYQGELTRIYKQISNREDYDGMISSIERMCTPTDNSINEKLSRIKKAFVESISDEYAKSYYISGERGSAMRIEIDRERVTIENG